MMKTVLVATATLLLSSVSAAAECPVPGSMSATDDGVPATSGGVTMRVLGEIDLGKEEPQAEGFGLRTRYLVFAPGATIQWHPHSDRAGTVYVQSGELTEYRSDCGAPLTLREGDISHEVAGMAHGWANLTDRHVIAIVADITPPAE